MPIDHGQLACRWLDEVWNKRNDAFIDEVMADDAVAHSDGWHDLRGKTAFRKFRDDIFATFPQLRITPEQTLADGNDAVVRWRVEATPKGSPSSVSFWGTTWFRFDNGRLLEGWDAWNEDDMGRKLQGGGLRARV